MRTALIQTELYWENPVANLAMLEEKIWEIARPVDLIVLPEMFTTGFTMKPKALAELPGGHTYKWMAQMARQSGAAICGSCIVTEKNKYFNRLVWVDPYGNFAHYDKRHLFRMGGEHLQYEAGNSRLSVTWKSWRISLLICYDLRFPVWSRNGLSEDGNPEFDLLIYVANWPAPRTEVWDTLLKARAIENLSWVIGVNRIGSDGNGIDYSGHSALIDYKGQPVHPLSNTAEPIVADLSLSDLQDFRAKFPAHLDADRFRLL